MTRPMDDATLEGLRQALASPIPHPDAAAQRDLGARALEWVVEHFSTMSDQGIGWTASRPRMEALLHARPPEEGQGFDAVLAEFRERVVPYAFRVNHPRFLAFIPSAPSFLSVLGDWLCAGSNFFCGVWLEAAGPSEVELVVLDWFRQIAGLPPDTRGILTSGGSEANLTALVVARERLRIADRPRAVLYVSALRHLSVDRAARIMGLGPEQVRPVPPDSEFRLRSAALADAVRRDRALGRMPWAVVANAGATNTGSVDPLAALAGVCQEEGLWLHADAAYGWPALLTPEGQDAMNGIALADSVTLDPHKWFGQTFESGCVLIRDGRRLAECFALRADYMQDVQAAGDEVNFADHGLALTRRFRALKIWFSVKALGLGWFRELVERCCQLADLAQVLLERSGDFEIQSPRRLSIVCFRYRPRDGGLDEDTLDRLNLAVIEDLRATGRAFISSTRLADRVALRFCFINWRTTSADVEEVVQLLSGIGRRLAGGAASGSRK